MKKSRWIRGVGWAVIAATTLFIWSRSLQPAAVSFEQSESAGQVLGELLGESVTPGNAQVYVRKTAHLVEFLLLGMEWGVARRWLAARARWVALAVGPLVAVCDELLQRVSAGRSAQLIDVLIDCAGYVAGWLLTAGAVYLITRRKRHVDAP